MKRVQARGLDQGGKAEGRGAGAGLEGSGQEIDEERYAIDLICENTHAFRSRKLSTEFTWARVELLCSIMIWKRNPGKKREKELYKTTVTNPHTQAKQEATHEGVCALQYVSYPHLTYLGCLHRDVFNEAPIGGASIEKHLATFPCEISSKASTSIFHIKDLPGETIVPICSYGTSDLTSSE